MNRSAAWLLVAFFLLFGFAVGGLIYLVRHPHIKVVPLMSEPVQSGAWEFPACPVAEVSVHASKRVGVPVGTREPLPYVVPAGAVQRDAGDSLWPVIVIKGHQKTTVYVPRG